MAQEVVLPFDVDLPPVKILKAGELNCMYEMGNLRYTMFGGVEIVRKIYGAVRNENWETLSCEMKNEEIVINESGFTIRYTAIYRQHSKDFYKADFLIEGKADNSILFSMRGEALAAFQRNRIGLCVHHPVKEWRGKQVTITQPDGQGYTSQLSEMVSPWQPFRQIQQMEWATKDDVVVKLSFQGDVFETEDQRNWSDASYKTYSTPQELPFPVSVKPGDKIEQRVTLKIDTTENVIRTKEIRNDKSKTTSIHHSPFTIDQLSEQKIHFPKIGYCQSKTHFLSSFEIALLSKIPFDHYRVSVLMNEHDWQAELKKSLTEAGQLNTQLELAVFFSDKFSEELELLILQLTDQQQLVRSILVLHKDHKVSPPELVQHSYPILKTRLPIVSIGYGTDFFFADLNRQRPGKIPFDFISFSLHPQAHAFDIRSLLENLENQSDIIETANSFAKGKPVCISPLTLKERHTVDDRQYSSFAAIWSLLSIKNLSATFSITCYEVFGKKGLLQIGTEQETGIIQSTIYKALVAMKEFRPVWIIKRHFGKELLNDGLLLENERGERLFFKAPPEVLSYKHGIG